VSYIDLVFPSLVLLLIAAWVHTCRRLGYRPWFFSLAVAGLVIISLPVLAALFAAPLESRYDRHRLADQGEAIVVLGGACDTPDPQHPFPPLAADSYSRSFYGALLFRSQRPRPILVTGWECAVLMAHYLEREGVPSGLILEENSARNTHENASFSSKILQARAIRKVTLVTDAKSMLRAELCFRREGLEVVPYPVGLGTLDFSILSILPSWQAIRANSITVHEVLGLLWYKHKGYI
jgi:uncharacterized SAM-binding protein YcdF (DUF218 family)